MNHQVFAVNPFLENTYLVWDDAGVAALIDPGMFTPAEQREVSDFVQAQGLKLEQVLLTHAHIDHVMGCAFAWRTWGLGPWLHSLEFAVLQAMPAYGELFGVRAEASPEAAGELKPGQTVHVGRLELQVLFTPGHSPGHVAFFEPQSQKLLSGDVLFLGSVGRVDLPGGDWPTLRRSIRETLLPLGPQVQVLPGHGPTTTLGHEALTNPFLVD